MVAFNASKLVCCAIDVITLMTWPISFEDSPNLDTVAVVLSATRTAEVAILAASLAFLAISLMLAPISSAPVATVCRFWLTCSAAEETTFACAEVSSELAVICWLVLEKLLAGSGYLHRRGSDGLDHLAQVVLHGV